MSDPIPLLEVRDLTRHFPNTSTAMRRRAGAVRAVDGISFVVEAGQTVSIVGESGCGKTTAARLVLRLDEPTSGSVLYRGESVHGLTADGLRRYRSGVQAVFQDPASSMNPRLRVGSIVSEPLWRDSGLSTLQRQERVGRLLDDVGLSRTAVTRYPHEFSGGMRQRLAIARALVNGPELVVLDEPVSALDVSIRAQVLNLLKDLQQEFGVAYLMISHNLATVRYLSDRVVVMYLGQIVEQGPSGALFDAPAHPYTRALISASSTVHHERRRERIVLNADLPSPSDPPAGCRFHTRCVQAVELCRTTAPALRTIAPDRTVACHLA